MFLRLHHHEHATQCRLLNHCALANRRDSDPVGHGQHRQYAPANQIHPFAFENANQIVGELIGQADDQIWQEVLE